MPSTRHWSSHLALLPGANIRGSCEGKARARITNCALNSQFQIFKSDLEIATEYVKNIKTKCIDCHKCLCLNLCINIYSICSHCNGSDNGLTTIHFATPQKNNVMRNVKRWYAFGEFNKLTT